jgi:hypothetical protein
LSDPPTVESVQGLRRRRSPGRTNPPRRLGSEPRREPTRVGHLESATVDDDKRRTIDALSASERITRAARITAAIDEKLVRSRQRN